MAEFLGVLAGMVGASAYIPYIMDVLKQKTKPDRASWTIWLIEYTVLFWAQAAKGATASLWLSGLQLAGVVAVCVLSVRYGTGSFNRHKIMLMLCTVIALLWWYISKDASWAVYIAVTVEASGVLLTSIKAYQQPGSETNTAWMLFGAAGILGAFAVGPNAPHVLYLYPIALTLMAACVLAAGTLGAQAKRRDQSLEQSTAELTEDL